MQYRQSDGTELTCPRQLDGELMNLVFVIWLLAAHLAHRGIDDARGEIVRTGKIFEADLVKEGFGSVDELLFSEEKVVPATFATLEADC